MLYIPQNKIKVNTLQNKKMFYNHKLLLRFVKIEKIKYTYTNYRSIFKLWREFKNLKINKL